MFRGARMKLNFRNKKVPLSFMATVSLIFIFLPTSVFATTSSTLNVKDFGATGDGVTDDAPAIERALNAVQSGGTVYIPTGIYRLATSSGQIQNGATDFDCALILGTANVIIRGDGEGLSILKLGDHTKMRMLAVVKDTTHSADNVIIQDLTFDGNKANRDGTVPYPGGDVVPNMLFGLNISAFQINEVEITSGLEDGVGCWACIDPIIKNIYSHDIGNAIVGASGISIAGTLGKGGVVKGNRLIRNGGPGLWVTGGATNVEISGNVIEYNFLSGIALGNPAESLSGIQILNNHLFGNGLARAAIGSFPEITPKPAISSTYIFDSIIEGNIIQGNGTDRISLRSNSSDDHICSNTNTTGVPTQILTDSTSSYDTNCPAQ